MTFILWTSDQVRVCVIIFVNIVIDMPLLAVRILEIHSFPHFSSYCIYIFEILYSLSFNELQSPASSIFVNCCRSYAPFGTTNPGNTRFSKLFSYMVLHIELKLGILLSFYELQTRSLSLDRYTFEDVMPPSRVTVLHTLLVHAELLI